MRERDGGESGLLRSSLAKGSSEFLWGGGCSGRSQMEAGLDCLGIMEWKEAKGWCHYRWGNRGSESMGRCGSWSTCQSVSPCLTGCSSPALVPSGPRAEPSTWYQLLDNFSWTQVSQGLTAAETHPCSTCSPSRVSSALILSSKCTYVVTTLSASV